MALTGLEIFKLLPNKNCGECKVPTCLAFAMKLAAKSVEPTACPYISEKAMEILGASQSPPIKKLSFKVGDHNYEIGAETVNYRHEKTFFNKTLIALEISDSLPDEEFRKKFDEIISYKFERVGETLYPECIALSFDSGNADNFISRYNIIKGADKIVVLSNITPDVLKSVAAVENNPGRLIINSVSSSTIGGFVDVPGIKEMKLVVESSSLEELFDAVQQVEKLGFSNLILKLKSEGTSGLLKNNVTLRRLAINKNFKPAGYPILTECSDELFGAIAGICKYSSVIILKNFDGAALFPLLTLRQNIYTDPQKPLQITPGIYNVKEPDKDSPVIVTTNFSLTYFIVSGEIENSPYSARLLITDSEGMSVLTAWSANKFSPEHIAKAVAGTNIESQVAHKKLIIPGFVAVLKGELEDKLKDWEIMVGPQEASDLPSFLKEVW